MASPEGIEPSSQPRKGRVLTVELRRPRTEGPEDRKVSFPLSRSTASKETSPNESPPRRNETIPRQTTCEAPRTTTTDRSVRSTPPILEERDETSSNENDRGPSCSHAEIG